MEGSPESRGPRIAEAGAGGDPRPTALHHFAEIVREVQSSLAAPSVWDREVHREKAGVEAFKLIRIVQPDTLRTIGRKLKEIVQNEPAHLPIVMGTYMAIRDAYLLENKIKATEVRRRMGLPMKSKLFPTRARR